MCGGRSWTGIQVPCCVSNGAPRPPLPDLAHPNSFAFFAGFLPCANPGGWLHFRCVLYEMIGGGRARLRRFRCGRVWRNMEDACSRGPVRQDARGESDLLPRLGSLALQPASGAAATTRLGAKNARCALGQAIRATRPRLPVSNISPVLPLSVSFLLLCWRPGAGANTEALCYAVLRGCLIREIPSSGIIARVWLHATTRRRQ
jgi:hypothetical protein